MTRSTAQSLGVSSRGVCREGDGFQTSIYKFFVNKLKDPVRSVTRSVSLMLFLIQCQNQKFLE